MNHNCGSLCHNRPRKAWSFRLGSPAICYSMLDDVICNPEDALRPFEYTAIVYTKERQVIGFHCACTAKEVVHWSDDVTVARRRAPPRGENCPGGWRI